MLLGVKANEVRDNRSLMSFNYFRVSITLVLLCETKKNLNKTVLNIIRGLKSAYIDFCLPFTPFPGKDDIR